MSTSVSVKTRNPADDDDDNNNNNDDDIKN